MSKSLSFHSFLACGVAAAPAAAATRPCAAAPVLLLEEEEEEEEEEEAEEVVVVVLPFTSSFLAGSAGAGLLAICLRYISGLCRLLLTGPGFW